MNREKSRVEYLDLVRAFGIILMIMGHIKFGSLFDKWIHAFHMPLFFFISGWFYRSKDGTSVLSQIGRKANSLLLPYVVFEIIQWIILLPFIPEYRSIKTLLYIFTENTYKIPVESGTFGISPIPGAMWFLTALFFVDALYIILDALFKRSWKIHSAIVILVAFGMFATRILPFRLPWALDAAFVGLGFFHIARVMRGKKVEKILSLQLWQAVIMGGIISALILVCPKINMRTGSYGLYLPFWFNALGAIIVCWNLARYAEPMLQKRRILRAVSEWLKGIGRNSIVYLCLNQLIILVAAKILGVNGIVTKTLVLIFTMVVLYGFECLIKNTKLKVIIGR